MKHHKKMIFLGIFALCRCLFTDAMYYSGDEDGDGGSIVGSAGSRDVMQLHEAALEGDNDFVEMLLAQDFNLHIRDDKGRTVLLAAVEGGCSVRVVKLLLQHGVNPNVIDVFGNTPLHVAVINHRVELVQQLLEGGTNRDQRNREGETPLELARLYGCPVLERLLITGIDQSLSNADAVGKRLVAGRGKCSRCSAKVMRDLEAARLGEKHERKCIIWNEQRERGSIMRDEQNRPWAVRATPEQRSAMRFARQDAMRRAEGEQNRPVAARATPEQLRAMRFARQEAMRESLARLAREDAMCHAEDKQNRPEDKQAAERAPRARRRVWLQEAEMRDLQASARRADCSSLHQAVKDGRREDVERLLKRGVDPNVQDRHCIRETALHFAVRARSADEEIVALLLRYGASPNVLDNTRVTPLMEAAGRCNARIVGMLCASGAELNLQSPMGTPLGYAWQNTEIAKMLLDHGADPNLPGGNFLHRAIKSGVPGMVALLLEYGANPNAKDGKLRTPLHEAAALGRAEVVELLLKHGADCDVRDENSMTPLLEAAIKGYINVTEQFCKHGVDCNGEDTRGRTVLHRVARNYRPFGDMSGGLRVILENGAGMENRVAPPLTFTSW